MLIYGEVLTEHIGNVDLNWEGEKLRSDEFIFERDISWLESSEVMIAEVTTPSLGVGYEIGIAEKRKIPILCLYRKLNNKKLSAMIQGNNKIHCIEYSNFQQAKKNINKFFILINRK